MSNEEKVAKVDVEKVDGVSNENVKVDETKSEKVNADEKVDAKVEVKNQNEDHNKPGFISKARYWEAVLWTENLIEDWQVDIDDILQVPFAYCVHDKDVLEDGSPRKEHMHIILAFSNTTTYNHALNIFKLLGENAVNTCQACRDIKNCYDYLIHDTESAKKKNKYLYDAGERIEGNNFDIGLFEQISLQEKRKMLIELVDFIMIEGFTNIVDFRFATIMDAKFNRFEYQDVLVSYTSTLDKFCAGNYKKLRTGGARLKVENDTEKVEQQHEKSTQKSTQKSTTCCPDCGSIEILKRGKTAGGTQRFSCKDCGKRFTL